MKGVVADEQTGSQRCPSAAANFNAKVLRKLQKAFTDNPNANLLSVFPTEYSLRLGTKKKQKAISVTATVATMNTPAERYSSADYRTSELTSSIGATTVVFPLSESVQHLLGNHTHDISTLLCQLTSAISSSPAKLSGNPKHAAAMQSLNALQASSSRSSPTSTTTQSIPACNTLRNTLRKSQHQSL
ncbi:hypothetical protein N7G274_009762 [Stereocaulon virgatum]|uniref:Uncharacterized protein n=1 Tax=Stereocaulon virgatum TaxID=373712 RepID=A0ABR3ZX00_9LECA